MQYQEERAKIQWQKKSEYIVKLMDLASAKFKDEMSKAILDEMRRNYEYTVTIFLKIVENRERNLNEKERVPPREFVLLREEDGSLFLEVRDNGKGITEAEIKDVKVLGLLGMNERALVFGGEISISGEPDEGTTVVLKIPQKQGEP